MSGNSWAHETNQAIWCSEYHCSFVQDSDTHEDPSPKTMRSWWRTEPQSPPAPNPSSTSKWGPGIYWEEWGDIKLVEKSSVLMPHGCQDPQWMGGAGPGEKTSCGLPDTWGPTKKSSWWDVPPCLAGLKVGDFLPLLFQGWQDIRVVRRDKMVFLAWALHRCAMQSGAPLGRLCGAVQDLCQCLTYFIEMDGLLSISMLDVAEGKPMTSPKPAEKTGPPDESEPQEEESTTAQALDRPDALESGGTGSSVELVMCRGICDLHHLYLLGHWLMSLAYPLEDVDSSISIPMGAQFDLHSLGSLQVMISYNPMMGEVWYPYQSRVILQISLQLDPPESLDWPPSPTAWGTISKYNASRLTYGWIKCS